MYARIRVINMNSSDLLNTIDKFKYISFDMFDTLVFRNVKKPSDIFKLVEYIYNRNNNPKVDFYKLRIKAEKVRQNELNVESITLDEIYDYLSHFLGNDVSDELKKIEINIEKNMIIQNKEIFDAYNYALSKDKDIYIISDMYMPSRLLEVILSKCGYRGYKKIIVSCEYRKTKYTGSLFKSVLRDTNLKPQEVLHIGDNRNSDYNIHREIGMNAYLYVKKKKEAPYTMYNNIDNINELMMYSIDSFITNTLDYSKDNAFKLGYSVFGPLLYGYTSWIQSYIKNNNIKKVFFFSRDGYIVKQAFEIINKEVWHSYLYVSRRSVVVPVLQYKSTVREMFEMYKNWPQKFSLGYALKKLGLSNSEISELLNMSYKLKKRIYTIDELLKLNDNKLSAFLDSIYDIVCNNSKKENKVLEEYLRQENFKDTLAIVDLGGNCTISYALNEFNNYISNKYRTVGLYLLLNIQETDNQKAFLYSLGKESYFKKKLRWSYMFLEVFFSAPHGSTTNYAICGNEVQPILEEDDKLTKTEKVLIDNLQSGALSFVENINKYELEYLFNNITSFHKFNNFSIFPSYEDAKIWGNYRFNADALVPLVSFSCYENYILNPLKFIRDYKKSLWKSALFTLVFKTSVFNGVLFKMYSFLKALKDNYWFQKE